jgi:hypothetical protein
MAVLFGEEKGGVPSESYFLSSGKRGASRTENRYQNYHKNYTEENRVLKSPYVPTGDLKIYNYILKILHMW